MKLSYYNPLGLYHDFKNIDGVHGKIQSLFGPAQCIHDRTETIKSPVAIVNQYPLIAGLTTADFATTCHERVLDILSGDHAIGILFSGGINSTLVSSLILQHLRPDDYDRITFFHNQSSILENQRFFGRYIQGKFKTASSLNIDSWLTEPNRVMLTGECADNLFGSPAIKSVINKFNDDVIHQPYERFVELLWRYRLGKNFDTIYDSFRQLIERCPFDLTTVYDWFWWLNFTTRWQPTVYRIYSYTDITVTQNKLIHFFNTEQFQSWSLHNHDLKIKNNWKSYKWLMKDMIHEFDHDSDYRDNKVKFPSLRSMIRFKPAVDYIGENFEILDKNQIEHIVV